MHTALENTFPLLLKNNLALLAYHIALCLEAKGVTYKQDQTKLKSSAAMTLFFCVLVCILLLIWDNSTSFKTSKRKHERKVYRHRTMYYYDSY